jgi:pimeloyl-ACP methyl ester carboxylesterase
MDIPANIGRTRTALRKLLGDLPAANRSPRVAAKKVSRRGPYSVEQLVLDLNGLEKVPAILIRRSGGTARRPAVLYCHSHGGFYDLGRKELLEGAPYLRSPAYGYCLADRGYAVLCIDNWAFGGRRRMTESATFKLMLWQGRTMWGMMVYDNLKALEYLRSRPDVDAGRIATLGMSMGSTMSWWLAALDTKVAACVDICCLTDFQALIESGGLDGHGVYYYVPGLLKEFTTGRINGLIAPRPHLALAGTKDPLTPAGGLDRVDREMKRVYGALSAPGNWRLVRYASGHRETADMRLRVLSFLEEHLAPGG